jgi:hypothetical protein
MARSAEELQFVSLDGEIVEILEEDGRRLAKVKLTAPVAVDLRGRDASDTHLGDRVAIRGWIFGIGDPKEDL